MVGWLCSGSGQDALQTLDDCFPPSQSSGVWEVDRAMVISPDPEQGVSAVSSNAVKTASWLNSTAYSKKGRSLWAREVNNEARGSIGEKQKTKH